MTETAKRKGFSMPLEPTRATGQGRWVIALIIACGVALYVGSSRRLQLYDLGYTDGDRPVTVQSWSIPLPWGYSLVYWRSRPSGPNDGLRLFGPR